MDYVDYIKNYPLKSFTRGETLLQKGEAIRFLMALRTGFVKITSISDEGVERLLWIAGRYDLVPIEKLFAKQGNVHFFYTALTDGTYYQIDKQAFIKEAFEAPALMAQIARGMSDHHDDLLLHIDALDTSSVREKLLLTLLYVAARLSGDDNVDLIAHGLRLTHADFANLIGSTRETTSMELLKLRKEGYVTYSRTSFVVHTGKIRQHEQSE
jgi:CRP/FNR family cyclic AMP-dependent transcriptional regulator